jgi:hypothetical protein
MNTELNACPFCACKMSLSAIARDWWRIAGDHDDECILHDKEYDSPQTDEQRHALIAAWNRRAQPVSAGLTDAESFEKFWADKYGEILAPTGDEDADAACRIAKCAASDAWGTALLSAAQRDSQPVASADARDAAILRAGAVLSNIAFNMAQRRLGEPLTGDDARALYNARNQWDAAIAASKEGNHA